MTAGVTMSGAVRDQSGQPLSEGHLMAHHGVTGDIIGIGDIVGGRYELRLLGEQSVYLEYDIRSGGNWYRGYLNRPLAPARRRGTAAGLSGPLAGSDPVSGLVSGSAQVTVTSGSTTAALSAPPRRPGPSLGLIVIPGSGALVKDITIVTS